MSKLTILVACTSLLALDGCSIAVQQLTKGRRSNKEVETSFRYQVREPMERMLVRGTAADDDNDKAVSQATESVEEIDHLRDSYFDWMNVARNIEHFLEKKDWEVKDIGDCTTGERKGSKLCKDAAEALATARAKMVEILTASLEATPATGFGDSVGWPAATLTDMPEDDKTMASRVDVSASIETLANNQAAYWNKRLEKAGGAVKLAHKEGTGACYFSDAPHRKDVQARVLFDSSLEDLHIRCAAPEMLSSYDRTENDSIEVLVVGDHGRESVKLIPIPAAPNAQTIDVDVPASVLAKGIKQHASKHRWATFIVRYVVQKKVGVRRIESSESVRFVDDIDVNNVATGTMVFDTKASAGNEVAEGEGIPSKRTASADLGDEDDAKPAPKAKKAKHRKKSRKH
jgi:hypothetical protein